MIKTTLTITLLAITLLTNTPTTQALSLADKHDIKMGYMADPRKPKAKKKVIKKKVVKPKARKLTPADGTTSRWVIKFGSYAKTPIIGVFFVGSTICIFFNF